MGISTLRRAVVVALLPLALAACGGDDGSGPATTTEAEVVAEGFPVTVENCGHQFTFDAPPERVVTDYQPAFETIVALGLGDRIAGRTNFEENGPDGFLPGQKAVYDATNEISDNIELPAKEVLLSQDADFILGISYASFLTEDGQATVDELLEAGTPAYITAGWCDPDGVKNARVDDVFDDITNLGLIFGVQDRAAALRAELEGIVADVEATVDGLEPVDVLATDGGSGPVNAYGGSGLFSQMIEIAGGRNVLGDLDEDYTEVSAETIAASDPDALLVLDYSILFGESKPTAQAKAEVVLGLVPGSAAATENRYLAVPAAATHSGYRNILAIPDIAAFLHPDAFESP